MTLIDIPITYILSKKQYIFNNAIREYDNIVLLGTPGSGKTSLLDKYEAEYEKSFKISIKEFIRLDVNIPKDIQVLLLDGLDEYRSFEKDKSFVITELAHKLKKYDCKKVISCRELDWYGDNDNKILKSTLSQDFEIFKINLLEETFQRNIINMLNPNLDADKIINRFSFTGLLKNPQLLKMIISIYQKDERLDNKKDIFESFIKISGSEHNDDYNSIDISHQDMFKYNGYLAFFYMFGAVDIFDDNILLEIANNEFKIHILREVVKSKLYKQETVFIHRTIAEYLCAKFIVDYKLNSKIRVNENRIQSLFVSKHNKILSELRGIYSWIGVLTQKIEWISIDPFYQLIYADNSFFDVEFKKSVLLSIKEYANISPYFIDPYLSIDLNGFYITEMDDFLIEEFNEGIKINNHYLLLITYVIHDAKSISDKLNDFIKKQVFDHAVDQNIKEKLLNKFSSDYKTSVLDFIVNGEIIDNEYNTLKESIIKDLYPNHINTSEIVKYIQSYSSNNMMMQCSYLYDTPFEDKYELVKEMYENIQQLVKEGYSLDLNEREPTYSIKEFIKNYFVEVCLNYKTKYTAREIFDILSFFQGFYSNNRALEFKATTIENKDGIIKHKESLGELANELFSIFIKEKIQKKSFYFYGFDTIYSLTIPSNTIEVFLNNITTDHTKNTNKELFWNAMSICKNKELNQEFNNIAEQYNMIEEIERFKNPPKREKKEWELKYEKEERQRDEELNKKRLEYKRYFDAKSDEYILNSFSDLKWVFYFINQAKGMIDDTMKKRFENILYKLLQEYKYKDEVNLKVLLSNIEKHREIDMIYYTALISNDNIIDFDLLDDGLKEYLYILSISKENVFNIDKPISFLKYIDDNFALKILKSSIKTVANDKRINGYIDLESDLKSLKQLIYNFDEKNMQINIIKNIVERHNFTITYDDSKYLYTKYNLEICTLIMKIQEEELLNQEELITLYTTLFRFDDYNKKFNILNSKCKIQIIYNMILIFIDGKMLKFNNGTQTKYDEVANFMNTRALENLTIEDLQLLLIRENINTMWTNSILFQIDKKSQNNDNKLQKININKLVEFIRKDDIMDNKDFFEEIYQRIKDIKQTIEDNRDNEKDLFYSNTKGKTENECRDIIVHKLKDRYGDILVPREQQEANNRVDINIKYTNNTNFEIQIECKRDDNSDLYIGVKKQLMDKYFSTNVQYGIYMIFYFGVKKNRDKMIKKIEDNIPIKYKNNIKILVIDLMRKKI